MKSSKKEKNLFLLFPDGSEVKNLEDIERLKSDFSFSPSTIRNWRLYKPDIEAYSEAAAKLFSLGLPDDESIIAAGPVTIYKFPKDFNEYIADAIVTTKHLIVYYQKSLMIKDFVIVELANASGVTSTGPWSAIFNFKNGIHFYKKGAFEMVETYFELEERLGKDGHANRRSISVMNSLAKSLIELKDN